MGNFSFASESDYENFCKFFPFSCVDLLIEENGKILLTKRTSNPFNDYWHLPGSMIRRNEKINDALKRVAKNEFDMNITIKDFLGVYESLDSFRHDLSIAYSASIKYSKIKSFSEKKTQKFFKKLPQKIIPHHKLVIQDYRLKLN